MFEMKIILISKNQHEYCYCLLLIQSQLFWFYSLSPDIFLSLLKKFNNYSFIFAQKEQLIILILVTYISNRNHLFLWYEMQNEKKTHFPSVDWTRPFSGKSPVLLHYTNTATLRKYENVHTHKQHRLLCSQKNGF